MVRGKLDKEMMDMKMKEQMRKWTEEQQAEWKKCDGK